MPPALVRLLSLSLRLLRSKQQDCDRPRCLQRLSPVLSRSTLMVMVLVTLPAAVADRPLLLRDENPMSGAMACKGQALQACTSWPPDKDADSSLRSASMICLPVQPILLSCTPLPFCNHD